MPFSSTHGKTKITEWITRLKPAKGLDIGVGCGTYADMFPSISWVGVEVWRPYVQEYNLAGKYKELIVEDVRNIASFEPVDLAVAGDVLEHMTAEDARDVLKVLRASAKHVIVSVPVGYYPQGEYRGNPYEEHVVPDWSVEDLIACFGSPSEMHIDDNICVMLYEGTVDTRRLKIAVYAISKNEAKFVQRFCKSAEEADIILVGDTGSTDDTIKQLFQHGASVVNISVQPFRFDLARNAVLAHLASDVDVCISLDLDEVLVPGWRDEIEKVWVKGQTNRLQYLFDWGMGYVFPYHKIHSRHGWHWHHPCHEDLRLDARVQKSQVWLNKVLVEHKPDPTKSRGQYMEILEVGYKEDKTDPTHVFYYARELFFKSRYAEAERALKEYLLMDAPSHQNERCYAQRVLGSTYQRLGRWQEAQDMFLQAAATAPNTREPWFELAHQAHHFKEWAVCYAFAMRALSIKDRAKVYTVDPKVWGPILHDLASSSAWRIGLGSAALEQAQLALALDPNDKRLADNVAFMKDALKK